MRLVGQVAAMTANDRTPPNDEQAEQTMIGLAMNLGRIPQAAARLGPSAFYRPVHETIWTAMMDLVGQQKPCDITVLRAYLQERGLFNTRGGVDGPYLFDLLQTPPAADPEHVARIIDQRAKRRAMIKVFERGLQGVYESINDAETQVQQVQSALSSITSVQQEAPDLRVIPGGQAIFADDDTARALWGAGQLIIWADGEALIIAGAQGLGKTTLAQQLALGWCGFDKYRELFGFPITEGRRALYLAMDRPRQALRSFRRMVSEDQRDELDDRLRVWKGPPPSDLAKHPELLLSLCDRAYADLVIVDSLKDAAIPLSDDEVGASYNRARQIACAAGVQMIELHHVRKQQGKKDADLVLDDLYGSTWITSGAGSVILLTGKPGDPIVGLRHLKPPAAEVGPYQILHDDLTGRSEIYHEVDLLEVVRKRGQINASDAAEALYDTEKPTSAEKQKAHRHLDRLVASHHLWVMHEGGKGAGNARLWAPK
jgi:AAA domain/DnaB-like helicase N terminal domain